MKNQTLTITFTGEQALALTQLTLLCGALSPGGVYVLDRANLDAVLAAGAAWQAALESGAESPAVALGRRGGRKGGAIQSEAQKSALAANRAKRWPQKVEQAAEVAVSDDSSAVAESDG